MISLQQIESILDEDDILFLNYGGTFTQSLIAGMTGVLEKEVEEAELSMSVSNNIFVVFIELAQNVMNYSKSIKSKNPKAIIYVGKNNGNYFVCSQNIISKDDKEKIEPLLKQIVTLSKDEVKKLYREVRRSGKGSHDKGGGLGFLEIAKKVKSLEYLFEEVDDKYYYKIYATI